MQIKRRRREIYNFQFYSRSTESERTERLHSETLLFTFNSIVDRPYNEVGAFREVVFYFQFYSRSTLPPMYFTLRWLIRLSFNSIVDRP